MIKKQHLNGRWKQRLKEKGNIFFTLFAAVGVVGALGVGSVTLLKGPVQTMVKINQKQVTEEYSELGLRVMMANILQSNANCDADNKLEAAEWTTPTGAESAPTGGGVFPNTYGTKITDPWGRRLGYCVWDHGSAIDDAGCGGATQNRLRGAPNDDTQPFITVISSGPNQQFETSCNDYIDVAPADGNPDTALLIKPANSDDLIVNYSMIEAKAAMGDNWVFDSNTDANADAAKTTQNLDFSQDVTFNGLLDLSKLGGGLILPDFSTATCDATTDGQLFRDGATTPPAVMVCDGGTWKAMSGGTSSAGNYAYDFDPEKANCTLNNGGPFALAGNYNTTGTAWAIWEDGTYIYVADGLSGVHAFTFNGSTFTLAGTENITATVAKAIWGDGTYIYVADDINGVHAFTFDGTSFTLAGTYNTTGNALGVWGDGTYIYIADQASGIHAFTFDGTNFTLAGTENITTTTARSVWGDGTYIYVADETNGVHAFTFDGTSFTLASTYDTVGSARDVRGDGTYIYVADMGSGSHAFTFDGTSFTLKDTETTSGSARRVWGDGTHIYITGYDSGVHAFTFDGTSFTHQNTYNTTGNAVGLWSDGAYIYVADGLSGITAFSGFECLSTTPDYSDRPDSPNTGVDYNYRAYGWGNDDFEQLGNGATTSGDQVSPTLVLGDNEFVQVGSWYNHGCGMKTNGTVWCWGTNDRGQLGDGSPLTTIYSTPQPIAGNHKFIQYRAGGNSNCALKSNGTVWCWGANNYGQLGNNDATKTDSFIPVKVANISDFIRINPGRLHSCGIRRNGEAWCWGDDTYGQLGNGATTGDQIVPVKVETSLTFVDIATGQEHSCALTGSGSIWCWGNNINGELGNGITGGISNTPVKVANISDFISVTVGYGISCGLRENGEAYCWGKDTNGELGNGAVLTGNQSIPTKVANITDFVKIEAGRDSACGIASTGKAYCWGSDNNGRLGNGSGLTGNQTEPTLVDAISNVVDISCHSQYCHAATKTLKNISEPAPKAPVVIEQSTTSGNTMGSHGLAIQYNSATSGDMPGLAFAVDAQDTAGTNLSSAIIEAGGSLNREGLRIKLNDGTGLYGKLRSNPNGAVSLTPTGGSAGFSPKLSINTNVYSWNGTRFDNGLLLSDAIGANKPAYYGIDSNTGNAIILSGEDLLIQHSAPDGTGRTSIASFVNTGVPEFYGDMIVSGNSRTATISAYTATALETAAYKFLRYRGTAAIPSTAIDEDYIGTISFTGFDGTVYNTNGTSNIIGIVADPPAPGSVNSRIAINKTGSGTNDLILFGSGNVGINSPLTASDTLTVNGRGAADNAIKAGVDTNCAVAADEGTVRFTGTEYEYCKSDGGGGYFWESVVPDPTCKDDATFVDISIGFQNTCATMSNGQGVCWGKNLSGLRSGTGSTTDPEVDLIPIKTFKTTQITTGYAVTDNNKIKAWGGNNFGALGNGTTTSSILPLSIASNEKFTSVIIITDSACGLTKNGEVYCWGQGTDGRTGLGSTATQLTPKKLDNVSNAIAITGGVQHACALLSNRKVKCWGINDAGQLGIGTVTAYEDSPQDTLISNVIDVSAGGRFGSPNKGGTCAVKIDGTVWCWGDNTYGQIGNGTSGSSNISTPLQVNGITNAIKVSRFRGSTCALLEDGTINCWGEGTKGVLGNGGTGNQSAPVTVNGISTAIKIADGNNSDHMCAILENGDAKCWGDNTNGELGNGTTGGFSTSLVDVINPLSCNSDKYVFVTEDTHNGNMGGLDGADAVCQAQAERASLPGRYISWLSTDGVSPSTRFNRITTDYKRVDGTVIANGFYDLISGTLDAAIQITADGTDIGDTHVWTGTNPDGTSKINGTCNGWTTNSATSIAEKGRSGVFGGNWTNSTDNGCVGAKRIYCFQQ